MMTVLLIKEDAWCLMKSRKHVSCAGSVDFHRTMYIILDTKF